MLPETGEILSRAGWFPGRKIPLTEYEALPFGIFPAARDILETFGGISCGTKGKGTTHARSSISIDPRLAIGLESEIDKRATEIGQKLYPLGEISGGHADLLVSENGSIYLLYHEIKLISETFEKALDYLLLAL